ncbi:MAG: hypothetical protein JW984_15370 [Deltaproteobacteria bacterium]|uniref:AdoMet activation domain-containing protein n=1 Tax=Candidatus Zymogenus saltonus TaxID=2844893 RepID=A0A9D8PP34_9DELT|nr:hypothetical protein [Candidatus Zymogenus saltonus]
MTVLGDIKIDIDVNDVLKIMGYRGERKAPKRIAAAAEEAKDRCLDLVEPRSVYEVYDISGMGEGTVSLNGSRFRGKVLQRVLAGSRRAVVFVATLGGTIDGEVKRLIEGGDTFSAVMLDTFGSVALGVASVCIYKKILELEGIPSGYGLTPSFGPGECRWDIREQRELFRLVNAGSIGVTLTETCLMIPKKSRSGIMGLGPIDAISHASPCDLCDAKECPGRDMLTILGIIGSKS